MTHDDVLALLALVGRDQSAVVAITREFSVKQWHHLTRELAVETSYGVSTALESYNRARRMRAEMILAEALRMGEP